MPITKHSGVLEFSTKGLGSAPGHFPLKKERKKNMGLKHWILPKDHTYFFQILGGGTLLSLDLGPKGVSNL